MAEPAKTPPKNRQKVKLRNIILPREHGGWAFVLNPVLLGLLVALSWQGALLGIAAIAAFLVHQPFKLWWSDYRVKRVIARTPIARNFALIYAVVAVVGVLVVLLNSPLTFLLPLALAFPLAQTQLLYDAQGRSRHLIPELTGAVALGSVAPAMAILNQWDVPDAMLLWLLLAIWAITSVLYVRVRLRLERNKVDDYDMHYVALLHGVGLVLTAMSASAGGVPWLAVGGVVVLSVRAAYGLSPFRRPAKAIQVGIQEVIFGLIFTLMVALGYADWF